VPEQLTAMRAALLALALWPGLALAQGPRLMAPPDPVVPAPAAGPRLLAPPDPTPLVAPPAVPATPLVAPASAPPLVAPPTAPAAAAPPVSMPPLPARAAAPAVFAARDLWDGAIEISPMWFAAEIARDQGAAERRYRDRVLQLEGLLQNRRIAAWGASLTIRVDVPGIGSRAFECTLLDDPIERTLAENLRIGQPAALAGTFTRNGLVFEMTNCIVLTGYPDPEGLRAWLVEEAERLRNQAHLENAR
jgi:hypothetical protein